MADIDISGIVFRAYYPGIDLDEEEEYVPLGPDDYTDTVGAIDIGVIRFRAWQLEFEDEEEVV